MFGFNTLNCSQFCVSSIMFLIAILTVAALQKKGSSNYIKSLTIKNSLWKKMTDLLVQITRLEAKRNAKPSYCLIDSQSTKTTSASEDRGFDGGKKSKAAND